MGTYTTTTYTTTTTTTTTTTWYKPRRYHRPKPHENINPNEMPEGLSPFNKYLVPKPITSTTYVYEPYKETTYAPPPLLDGLPEYTSRKYDAEHNPAIPYREPENPYEKPHQPYQHTFPKYTKPEYSPPATEYSPPATEYSPPATEYSPPPTEYSPPEKEYSPPEEKEYSGYRRR